MLSKNKTLLSVTASALSLSVASIAQASPIRDKFLLDIPLSESSMIGSHNSYNTTAKGWGYIADPNHDLSLNEQLNESINFIELDVHHDTVTERIILCHKVCDTTAKTLNEGLDKIKGFLSQEKDKNRVIILYIEDYSRDHSRLAGILDKKLGDDIYKSGGCKAVPNSLTPRQILSQGKRVIVFKGEDIYKKTCSSDAKLKNMVFTDLGGISRHAEDRTNISNFGALKSQNPKNLVQEQVVNKQSEGTNLINLDFIERNEKRAQLWNWAPSHPRSSAGNCAVLTSGTLNLGNGKRWHSANCARQFKFACQHRSNKTWKITPKAGSWSQGHATCETLGSDYFFSVPHNAQDNVRLSNVGSNLWLNYTSTISGQWEPIAHAFKQPVATASKQPVHVKVVDVDIAPNGTVWAITPNNKIKRRAGGKWYDVPGTATHIAVDSANIPWHLNVNSRSIWKGTDVNGTGWSQVTGCANDIAAGKQGQVWALDCDDRKLAVWNGSNGWIEKPGVGDIIKVNSTGKPIHINNNDNTAWKAIDANGSSPFRLKGDCIKDIAEAQQGAAWAIDCDRKIFKWNKNKQDWDQKTGLGDIIEVDDSGIPYHVNADNGSIWKGIDAQATSWKQIN